jgi:hypothetical protein
LRKIQKSNTIHHKNPTKNHKHYHNKRKIQQK